MKNEFNDKENKTTLIFLHECYVFEKISIKGPGISFFTSMKIITQCTMHVHCLNFPFPQISANSLSCILIVVGEQFLVNLDS